MQDSNDASFHINEAERHARNGEYHLAIEACNKAIKLDPESAACACSRILIKIDDPMFAAEYYKSRGLAYYHKEEYENAIQNYDEAIRFNPTDADAYYNLGIARLAQKNCPDAEKDLKIASEKGLDVVAAFHRDHTDIWTFQEQYDVELPEYITILLNGPPHDMGPA